MPSITDMIDARIAKFMRALRLPYRARVSALNGDPALQMAAVRVFVRHPRR